MGVFFWGDNFSLVAKIGTQNSIIGFDFYDFNTIISFDFYDFTSIFFVVPLKNKENRQLPVASENVKKNRWTRGETYRTPFCGRRI